LAKNLVFYFVVPNSPQSIESGEKFNTANDTPVQTMSTPETPGSRARSLSAQFANLSQIPVKRRRRGRKNRPRKKLTPAPEMKPEPKTATEREARQASDAHPKKLHPGHHKLADGTSVLYTDSFLPYFSIPAYHSAAMSMDHGFIDSPLGTKERVRGSVLGRPRPGSRVEMVHKRAMMFMRMMNPKVVTADWDMMTASDVRLRGHDALMPSLPFKYAPDARVFVGCGYARCLRLRLPGKEPVDVELANNCVAIVFPASGSLTMHIRSLPKDAADDAESVITVIDYKDSVVIDPNLADKLWGAYY